MKKILLTLMASAAVVCAARAAVVLDEPFTYADGVLNIVSGGVWTNHSGTANQVDVASGKANLTQSESEDVFALLAGRPYSSGNLYASLVINYSSLPSGAGGYFAHFKDDGTVNFRGRTFASITGAAAGQFRVGIANGGNAPVLIATDLSLGQDYVLVLRYDTEAGTSTLWINPASEGATSDRADGTDTTTAVGITTFAMRQSLATGNGMGTLTLDNLKVGTTFADVVGGGDPRLNPPAISSVPDQRIPANNSTPAIPVTVSDGETAVGDLTLSANSDNTGLVPVENVTFGGSGSDRTVTVTPAAGQQGSATITVTVTDGDNNTASRNFRVIVGAPTISAISNQTAPKDTPSITVPFIVGDSESDALIITATSTNEVLVHPINISFEGDGPNRTAIIVLPAGVSGLSRIAISVSDGFNSASNGFVLTVYPTRGVDFNDAFDYADGSVVTSSSFTWNTHSAATGQTGQTQVAQGKLLLSSSQSEDIHAFLTNSPYPLSEGWILFSRFTVNFTARPSGAGDYFAHFRNTGNSFGARVFATTAGAASTKLRLGIANNATSPNAILPVDLDTNVEYTVITSLNVGTGQSTLWVNPASENDPSVTATDNAFPFEIWTYAFRQSGGIGALAVDDVKIGTSFSDVSEVRYRLQISATGGNVLVSWPAAARDAGYRLQSAGSPDSAIWADVTDPPSEQGPNLVASFTGVTGNQFFRLVK